MGLFFRVRLCILRWLVGLPLLFLIFGFFVVVAVVVRVWLSMPIASLFLSFSLSLPLSLSLSSLSLSFLSLLSLSSLSFLSLPLPLSLLPLFLSFTNLRFFLPTTSRVFFSLLMIVVFSLKAVHPCRSLHYYFYFLSIRSPVHSLCPN